MARSSNAQLFCKHRLVHEVEDSLHDQKGFALIFQPMQVIGPRDAYKASSVHSMHQVCLMLHRLVLSGRLADHVFDGQGILLRGVCGKPCPACHSF